MEQLVIFDGDDTLWITEPLYDDARHEAGAVVAAAGLNEARWELLQRDVDVRNVEVFGLSPERFPTSCVQAAEVLAHEVGRSFTAAVARAIWSAAEAVSSGLRRSQRSPPKRSRFFGRTITWPS